MPAHSPRRTLNEWKGCDACKISCDTPKKALLRHRLSAPYLIVAEAPGKQEVLRGLPFVGPSGKLLYQVLDRLSAELGLPLTREDFAATNVVACIPLDSNESPRQPSPEEAANCEPRLDLTLRLWAAKSNRAGIIFTGKVAARYATRTFRALFPKKEAPPLLKTTHPAYWLRNGGYHGVACHQAREQLREFLKETWQRNEPAASLPVPSGSPSRPTSPSGPLLKASPTQA